MARHHGWPILLMAGLAWIACHSPTASPPGLAHRGAWLTGVRAAEAPPVVDAACQRTARYSGCVLEGLTITRHEGQFPCGAILARGCTQADRRHLAAMWAADTDRILAHELLCHVWQPERGHTPTCPF